MRFGGTAQLLAHGKLPAVLTPGVQPADVALAFLVKYGDIFGMVDPAQELRLESFNPGPLTSVSFTQTEGGVDVSGTRLTMEFGKDGAIASVSGPFVPHLYGFSTQAALTPAEAAANAKADAASKCPTCSSGDIQASPHARLVIFPRAAAPAKLAYELNVTVGHNVMARLVRYVVDANSGAILVAFSGMME